MAKKKYHRRTPYSRLIRDLCKSEAGKEISVGNMREVVKLISRRCFSEQFLWGQSKTYSLLLKLGRNSMRKKLRKK